MLIEFLRNRQPGVSKESVFGCITNAENFMGNGFFLYSGDITVDERCYDTLTDDSSDKEVSDALDKAVQYNWRLQTNLQSIDKDDWVGFWRRYNLLQFFSNSIETETISVEPEVIDREEVKMYYPGLEDIVDQLLDNNIKFGLYGDVDLTDTDGIVLASAGMLIKESKVAIDPIDEDSATILEQAGYTIINSNNFDINVLKTN